VVAVVAAAVVAVAEPRAAEHLLLLAERLQLVEHLRLLQVQLRQAAVVVKVAVAVVVVPDWRHTPVG